MSAHDPMDLVHEGVALKRRGQLVAARSKYVEAMELDPRQVHVYHAWGKVAYLLGDRTEACQQILTTLHLSLAALQQQPGTMGELLRRASTATSGLRGWLARVDPSAALLPLLTDGLSQLGHALLDLDPTAQRTPELEAAASLHHRLIAGQTRSSMIDYELRYRVHLVLGYAYAVRRLQYDDLDNPRPLELYNGCHPDEDGFLGKALANPAALLLAQLEPAGVTLTERDLVDAVRGSVLGFAMMPTVGTLEAGQPWNPMTRPAPQAHQKAPPTAPEPRAAVPESPPLPRSFRGQKLNRRNFRHQSLPHADFTGASLRDADFYRSTLTGVSFRNADLTGADLRNTDLRGADFTGAVLDRVRMTGARKDEPDRRPGAD